MGKTLWKWWENTEYLPPSVNPRFTDSVSLTLAFCLTLPFAFSLPFSPLSLALPHLCRKLQENQDSMTSRLEEAEHKAQSLQTGKLAAWTGCTRHPDVVLSVNVSCFQQIKSFVVFFCGSFWRRPCCQLKLTYCLMIYTLKSQTRTSDPDS